MTGKTSPELMKALATLRDLKLPPRPAPPEPWPFLPRQRVRIVPSSIAFVTELADVVYEVVGVTLDRRGRIRVHISEGWPQHGGIDDMPPEDLCPV